MSSVSFTEPNPGSRPLDALGYHIQHKNPDKIVQILEGMPSDQSKEIKAALPKVTKAFTDWSDSDYRKLTKALNRAVEKKFVRLSVDKQTEVLNLVSKELNTEIKKFTADKTAFIINKIYQVEMMSKTSPTHLNSLKKHNL